MKLKGFILFILSISSFSWSGDFYQCESPDGKTSFQGTPCEDEHKTIMKKEDFYDADKEKKVAVDFDAEKLTTSQRNQLYDYSHYEQGKALLAICRMKGASSSSFFSNALQGLAKNKKVNIAKGKVIYESGTEDVSAASIKGFVNRSIEASENRVRSIPASSIEMPCRAISKRFMY
jgi:hypothetical protein